MDSVDDVFVFKRRAIREQLDGVPLCIAEDNGVRRVDRADGLDYFLGSGAPVGGCDLALAHVGLVQELEEDVFAGARGVVRRHVLPHVRHHLDIACVLGAGLVVTVVVFVVVDYERHSVLAGPFHEGVEHGEEVFVVELEFDGGVGHEGVAVGGVLVEVDGESERLDAVVGHEFHVGSVELEFALEQRAVFFKPVRDVDALVEVLHRLGLERVANGDVADFDLRNLGVVNLHVGGVLRYFARVLQVDVVPLPGSLSSQGFWRQTRLPCPSRPVQDP